MRIQNNLMAMNTHRQLGVNNLNQTKSTEKLSSGYRINRAADDASGLSISEKMRAQIRGLNQASANAQDGISLVQAAEGALQESHSILQRMRELSVKAANDVNETEDRNAIQKELDQLTAEVDRIAFTTEFNKKTLLNGSLSNGSYMQLDSAATNNAAISGLQMATPTDAVVSAVRTTTPGGPVPAVAAEKAFDISVGTAIASGDTISFDINGTTYTTAALTGGETDAQIATAMQTAFTAGSDTSVTVAATGGKLTITSATADAAGNAIVGLSNVSVTGTGTVTSTADAAATIVGADATTSGPSTSVAVTIGGVATTKQADGSFKTAAGDSVKVNEQALTADGTFTATYKAAQGAPLTLQVGANAGADQTIKVSIQELSASGLGLVGLDVSDHTKAQSAIASVEKAISTVSEQRSALGAVQNRLEHTVANLDTVSENLQSAESRIRDVDMAKEMMAFTKNNILTQAATAMLAQANQAPQTVLQLLR